MSDHGHDQHEHGAVHVHVHPTKLYAMILGALLVLTVITVAASKVDIDKMFALGGEVQGVGAWNLTLALLIATMKASLVLLFFMHLKDDARFNGIILLGAVLFIGVFFAYTMNDVALRGTMDRYNGVRVDPDTGLRAPGGVFARIPGQAAEPGLAEPRAAAVESAAPGEAAPASPVPPGAASDSAPAQPAEGDASAPAPDAGGASDAGAPSTAGEGEAVEEPALEGPAAPAPPPSVAPRSRRQPRAPAQAPVAPTQEPAAAPAE